MSAQPLNTTIKIYRTVRAYRQPYFNECGAALTKGLRPLVMSVPGGPDKVAVLERDTDMTDFSPYMGQSKATAVRGMPVVVGVTPFVAYADAVANIGNISAPISIGRDKFITNNDAGLAGDLHKDLRAVAANV